LTREGRWLRTTWRILWLAEDALVDAHVALGLD
jgi:hypothetical protein